MSRVIFNISFTVAEPGRDWSFERKAQHKAERAFYNGTAQYSYFDYTENDKKVVIDEKEQKINKNYMEKTSGVFNKNGVLTAQEKAELAKKLRETKSIIWHGFISFDDKTSPMFETQDKCIDFIGKTFDTYIRENGLNKDNIEAFFSLHQDTDNRHIHFCFFEKEPHYNSKGVLTYRRKGTFGDKIGEEYRMYGTDEKVEKGTKGARKVNIYDDKGRDCFLYVANDYIEDNKHLFGVERENTKKIIEATEPEMLTSFTYTELRRAFIALGRELPKTGRLSYQSENMKPYRKQVDAVVKLMVNNVPLIRQQYEKTIKAIYATETSARKICEQEELAFERVAQPKIRKYNEDYSVVLGNQVIRIAKAARFDEFSKGKETLANNLARKIEAKNNRRAVMKGITRLMRDYSQGNSVNSYDFSAKLRKLEWEIAKERERQAVAYGG